MIEHEQLGADEIPDLLAINFSSNDYVGHQYGPDSAEVLDLTVQTDRQLSAFFNWLQEEIGLDHTLIVLTSDHGASPNPSEMKEEAHFDSAVVDERAMEAELNGYLRAWHGFRDGETNAVRLVEYNVYIQTGKLTTDSPAAVIRGQVAAHVIRSRHLGFYAAYTRDQILAGQLPRTDICDRIMKGYHPENSGDVVLVPKPFYVHLDPKYPYVTSHGSPYAYDTSVPLLFFGPGIKRVTCLQPVSTLDIAPTLSYLLGILRPSGCEGRILADAVPVN